VILEVSRLDEFGYEESISSNDYKPTQDFDWQQLGRHHLSMCHFQGSVFLAMDGCAKDILSNKIINGVFKLFKG
jgi:hypothetical protein